MNGPDSEPTSCPKKTESTSQSTTSRNAIHEKTYLYTARRLLNIEDVGVGDDPILEKVCLIIDFTLKKGCMATRHGN